MTKEREALTLAQEVIQMLGAPSPLHFSKEEIIKWQECNTAIKEALAQQGRIEKQMGEIIKSLRCPNCESLERQNAELDLRLAEQDQPPFGFLTNKRQRFNFEPNATGLSNMPMTIDWKIPLYGSPQPQRKPPTPREVKDVLRSTGLLTNTQSWEVAEEVMKLLAAHGIKGDA